jgi:hypothetical protein
MNKIENALSVNIEKNIENFIKMTGNKMLPIIYDTEFTGLTKTTNLTEIGLVNPLTKACFYATVDHGIDESKVRSNLNDYIFNKTQETSEGRKQAIEFIGSNKNSVYADQVTLKELGELLSKWLQEQLSETNYDKILMVGDTLSYDNVLFNDIWGHAYDVPSCVHYAHFDISPVLMIKAVQEDMENAIDINRAEFANTDLPVHNSLSDAAKTVLVLAKLFL